MSRDLDSLPLAQWEYRELTSAAAWIVIQGITRGERLESSVSQALQLALQWKADRDKATSTPS